MASATHAFCRFEFKDDELTIANRVIERRWKVRGGFLHASSLVHLATNTKWIAKESAVRSPFVVGDLGDAQEEIEVTWSDRPLDAVQRSDTLVVNLSVKRGGEKTVYRFQVFSDSPGVTIEVSSSSGPITRPTTEPAAQVRTELSGPASAPTAQVEDVLEAFELPANPHLKLIAVKLVDQTDLHENLVFEKEYRLHPAELLIQEVGDIFAIEDTLSGEGIVFLKHAPLPHARPIGNAIDLVVRGRAVSFRGHGIGIEGGSGYAFATLAYSGGREGRTVVLHRHQRQLRQYLPGRDGLLLTNTWGDRARDTKLNEAFIRAEIAAAEKLGADIVQIDDGWQKGRSSNTSSKGVNQSFWDRADFWTPDDKRFPNGLAPLVAAAKEHGLQIGLWFAPDSTNDFANWQRDADALLEFHRTLGINFFKLDGIKMRSKAGEVNLHKLLAALVAKSEGKITVDLDVTAQLRPGYLGAMSVGPVFVENRYTDWHRYWPHCTLRNLWQLAQYIDPVRLRMEFLNNARNTKLYENDPLAPARYDPAYLFATVMFASPLAWFEVSQLPPAYIESASKLIRVWRESREKIFGGTIAPIGDAPSGTSWTGFLSRHADDAGGHVLIFRELNEAPTFSFEHRSLAGITKARRLFGSGELSLKDGVLTARLDQPLSFVFAELMPA